MPNLLHEHYDLTITTLTPLHIGTGDTLLKDYDFVVKQKKTWVVDDAALAAALYDRDATAFKTMIAGARASDLLTDSDYVADSPLFRYVMAGQPRAASSGSRIQTQIKNAYDEPYIPGSSLKGVLRTALLFGAWQGQNKAFTEQDLYENPHGKNRYPDREAAQKVEQALLVGDVPDKQRNAPNYDLLRALQVSDSSADRAKQLQLLNVTVITGDKAAEGAPIELEAVPRGQEFHARLTLDRYLLDQQASRLGWSKAQTRLITRLPRVVNFWAQQRLAEDASRSRWGSWRASFNELVRYYENNTLAENEFIVQLGWGGGWDSKTLGAHLTRAPKTFYRIVRIYQRQMDRQQSYREGDRFPKSRRVVVQGDHPLFTLGWVKIRMDKRG